MTSRIKEGFVLRELAEQAVVIATGEAGKDFHGMIKLNDTGTQIWKGLAEGRSDGQIADGLAEDYGIDRDRAASDVAEFVGQAREQGFLA